MVADRHEVTDEEPEEDDGLEMGPSKTRVELGHVTAELTQAAMIGQNLLERSNELEEELRLAHERCSQLESSNRELSEQLSSSEVSIRRSYAGSYPVDETSMVPLRSEPPADIQRMSSEIEAKWESRLQDAIDHSRELEEECERLRKNAAQAEKEKLEAEEMAKTLSRRFSVEDSEDKLQGIHEDQNFEDAVSESLKSKNSEASSSKMAWPSLAKVYATQKVEAEATKDELEKLRKANRELQSQKEEMQTQMEELEQRHQVAVQAKDKYKEQIANLRHRCDELEDARETAQRKLVRSQLECRTHKVNVEELTDLLENEKSNKSIGAQATSRFGPRKTSLHGKGLDEDMLHQIKTLKSEKHDKPSESRGSAVSRRLSPRARMNSSPAFPGEHPVHRRDDGASDTIDNEEPEMTLMDRLVGLAKYCFAADAASLRQPPFGRMRFDAALCGPRINKVLSVPTSDKEPDPTRSQQITAQPTESW